MSHWRLTKLSQSSGRVSTKDFCLQLTQTQKCVSTKTTKLTVCFSLQSTTWFQINKSYKKKTKCQLHFWTEFCLDFIYKNIKQKKPATWYFLLLNVFKWYGQIWTIVYTEQEYKCILVSLSYKKYYKDLNELH